MKCNQATCFKLWKAAKECRDAQKQYFTTRDKADLRTAKAMEKNLDIEIINFNAVVNHEGSMPADIAINQPDFFDGGSK